MPLNIANKFILGVAHAQLHLLRTWLDAKAVLLQLDRLAGLAPAFAHATQGKRQKQSLRYTTESLEEKGVELHPQRCSYRLGIDESPDAALSAEALGQRVANVYK